MSLDTSPLSPKPEVVHTRERLTDLLGGSVPDVVVVLGGGLTKGTVTGREVDQDGQVSRLGVKRERTSPYSGLNTIKENPAEALASGARARSLAAATIAEYFPEKDLRFITTGGSTRQDKGTGDPYAGNNPSAFVITQELQMYGKVPPEKVTQLTAPTTTATELMEIILDVAQRLQRGEKVKNYAIIASGYQTPRLKAFIDVMREPSEFEWLLKAHALALKDSAPEYQQAFAQHDVKLRQAMALVLAADVQLHAVSAESVLESRNSRWKNIVQNILPNWGPWKNQLFNDANNGVKDLKAQKYTFGRQTLESYLRSSYPQTFMDTQTATEKVLLAAGVK